MQKQRTWHSTRLCFLSFFFQDSHFHATGNQKTLASPELSQFELFLQPPPIVFREIGFYTRNWAASPAEGAGTVEVSCPDAASTLQHAHACPASCTVTYTLECRQSRVWVLPNGSWYRRYIYIFLSFRFFSYKRGSVCRTWWGTAWDKQRLEALYRGG